MLIAACGKSGGLSADDIALNNRGVALMGYFDYSGARETFVELTERRPEWLDAKVNLAISTLNRQEEGDEQRALEILDDVLQRQPDHLRANYVSGLLRLYLGETEASLQHLRLVADADPEDAYAAYFIAQNLLPCCRCISDSPTIRGPGWPSSSTPAWAPRRRPWPSDGRNRKEVPGPAATYSRSRWICLSGRAPALRA
jgi:hypothetical protein